MAVEGNDAHNALNAYLSLLKSKGAATGLLNQRKHFLRYLISALDAQQNQYIDEVDAGFRQAVDMTLNRFPEREHIDILTCSREFYPFWMGDLKTISRMHAANALSTQVAELDFDRDMISMFTRMDADPWSRQVPLSLERYITQLKQNNAAEAVIDLNERILMLLMYGIRRADPSPNIYRAGVDAILLMFPRDEGRKTFITVAREFFYFWNEDTPP
ncbi:hypothetical protein KSF73_08475 [Burkholderiaceae bacterium DAT-1]|nr:hypothetical protein [Burkholderiaceae bacterium DAT-1]